MEPDRAAIRRQLLSWYRAQKRDLPFRRTKDPYRILVAEFLLQRTRVKAGLPYYERFLAAFPTVRDLAGASEADVLRVWEGLGFYRRAQNLHRAAKAIVAIHGGELPADLEALDALPGVGEYTAGAVGSIAFGLRAPAIDGNVTRVLSRVFLIEDDPFRGAGWRRVRGLAAELVPKGAPGEWNQALMELGAVLCLPRRPRCVVCPIREECLARVRGLQERVPRVAAKPPVPTVAVVFAVVHKGESVLLVRLQKGLHAGMHALPGGSIAPGESAEDGVRRHLASLGVRPEVIESMGPVRHAFSHLRWNGFWFRCRVRGTPQGASWVNAAGLSGVPVVPLHRRLIERAGIYADLRRGPPRS